MGDLDEGKDIADYLNPKSLEVVHGFGEPAVRNVLPEIGYQFLRNGYFTPDSKDHHPQRPVFNRTVTLKDTWAKIEKNSGGN